MNCASIIISRLGGCAGIVLMLIATSLFVVSVAPAQVPEGNAVLTFFEPVEVRLVNVDVHVTGPDGRAVPGLTLADFELLEDGRPVEITHFATVSEAMDSDTAHKAQLEPTELSGPELSLVVFLDESSISPRQYRTTIDHLREFLAADLPATLRLMLVTFEDRATVRLPLTDDPSRVVSVLDEIAQDFDPRLSSERDRILRDLQKTAGALGPAANSQSMAAASSFEQPTRESRPSSRETSEERVYKQLAFEARQYVPTIRAFAASQRRSTERLLGELEMLVRSLSVVSGRKAVLFVSGGLEAQPGEGLFLAWERAFPEIARQMQVTAADEGKMNDVRPNIKRLVGSANLHRVSFYAVSDSDRTASGSSAEAFGVTRGRDIEQTMADQSGLLAISRATSGRLLLSSPGLADSLGDVVHEMGSGYSLGYSPGHPAGGQHHTLSVRVHRQGLDVRHREGYLHSPSTNRIVDRTLAAAMHGVTNNPLGVSVEMEEVGPPRADGGYLVPVLVKVPIARLMLRPEGDRQTGQITALVMVRGAKGLSEPQSWRYPISVTNDQMMEALGSQAGLVLHLVMGKGTQWIAVGVRDDVSGTEATATLEVDLAPPPSTGEIDG